MQAADGDADTRVLVFATPVPGDRRGHEDTVVVHRTQATGPGGHPVYCDDTGIVRAEISDRDEVRLIASSTHQDPRRPVVCRRVHPQDPAA